MISILTIWELEYRVVRASEERREQAKASLRDVKERFPTVGLTAAGGAVFARLKAALRERLEGTGSKRELGRTLGQHTIDLVVASTAIAHGCTAVSNDRIFSHLAELDRELRVENWTA